MIERSLEAGIELLEDLIAAKDLVQLIPESVLSKGGFEPGALLQLRRTFALPFMRPWMRTWVAGKPEHSLTHEEFSQIAGR